ncbi:ectoine/hydroxyectoine ABC transporter substrate-binding protein EhuB [Mesorhizobium caraganae]|uniref:ectoine/hydroxyectoine ABC transporter substrate-binding protein EhuB n=1 Tax=Mesorhizobium caraganae TaxID=483206 RepID=UPI0024843A06|nr:ectoine/hydroxyectoine ABC transporter substrate-binding protein EhuB [Mesorhizobium caraganae]
MTLTRRNLMKLTGAGLAGAGLLAVTGPSLADDKIPSTLRVGMSNQLPYAFLDKDGNLTGQSPDVLRAAMRDAGVEKLDASLTEFGALIPGLVARRFDVICTGLFVRPKRCELIDFANPDSLSREGLVVAAGNPMGLKSLGDVAKNGNARIGFIRGSVDEEYVKNAGIAESNWVVLPDVPTLLSAVKGGRADAVISSLVIIASTMKAMNDSSVQLVDNFVDPVVNGKPAIDYAAMGFHKDSKALREAYNTGLAKLVSSGELAKINEKWGLPAALTPTAETPSIETLCKA